MSAKVFVVEDHAPLREMLKELIMRTPGFEVCGWAADAESALEQLADSHPDVVLIDVSLPGKSGLELTSDLATKDPTIRCVVLSGHMSTRYSEEARIAGAKAYVAKCEVQELREILRDVLKGGTRFRTF